MIAICNWDIADSSGVFPNKSQRIVLPEAWLRNKLKHFEMICTGSKFIILVLLLLIFFCKTLVSGGFPKLSLDLFIGEIPGFELVSISDETNDLPLNYAQVIRGTWRDWADSLPYIIPFSRPAIVFLHPVNLTHFQAIIRQVGSILSQDLNPWLTWTPIFFIIWPSAQQQGSESALTYLRTNLLHVSVPMDTDVFILDDFNLYEIYSLRELLKVEPVLMEDYSGFSNYLRKSVRRQNLNGMLLNCVAFPDPDYGHQVTLEERNGTFHLVSGLAVILIADLQYALNFTPVAVKGEGWSEQLENGTWTGMAKQLQNFEADVSISLSMMVPDRLTGLDFLHPASYGMIMAFFRQPHPSSIRDIFISPLQLDLWVCLLLLWILLISAMGSMYWIGLKYAVVAEADAAIVDESILWSVGTLCQKGWHVWPTPTSMKIAFLCGSSVGLIYYVAFSAALVSTLSVEVIPIRSMLDLAQSQLQVLGDFWLPNSHAIVEEIVQFRMNCKPARKADQYIEIDDAIPALLTKPVAYLTFQDGFLTVFQRHNYTDQYYCETFSAIPVSKAPLSTGFTVRKGSSFREVFNHKILMMGERGLNFRSSRIYFLDTSARCSGGRAILGQGLGINDVVTAYFILFGGFGLSFVWALLERFLGVGALFQVIGRRIRLKVKSVKLEGC